MGKPKSEQILTFNSLPSSHWVGANVMKNWLPLVFGPLKIELSTILLRSLFMTINNFKNYWIADFLEPTKCLHFFQLDFNLVQYQLIKTYKKFGKNLSFPSQRCIFHYLISELGLLRGKRQKWPLYPSTGIFAACFSQFLRKIEFSKLRKYRRFEFCVSIKGENYFALVSPVCWFFFKKT